MYSCIVKWRQRFFKQVCLIWAVQQTEWWCESGVNILFGGWCAVEMVNDSSCCTQPSSTSGPALISGTMVPRWLALEKTSILSHWWANVEKRPICRMKVTAHSETACSDWDVRKGKEGKCGFQGQLDPCVGDVAHVKAHPLGQCYLWRVCVCVLYVWEWMWWNLMKYAYACQTSSRRITLTRKAKKRGWCENFYSSLFCMMIQ